jgi:hypothetical protein
MPYALPSSHLVCPGKFVLGRIVPMSINGGRAGLQPDAGRVGGARNGRPYCLGGVHPRFHYLPSILSVVLAVDAATRQIDDNIRTVEFLCPRPRRAPSSAPYALLIFPSDDSALQRYAHRGERPARGWHPLGRCLLRVQPSGKELKPGHSHGNEDGLNNRAAIPDEPQQLLAI